MAAVVKQKKWSYGIHLYVAVAYAVVMLALMAVYLAMSQPASDRDIFNTLLSRISVLLPVIVIWLIAAIGAKRFKNYAVGIQNSEDGRSMNYLANGLLLSVAYVILYNFVSAIIILAAGTPFSGLVKVLANHVPLIIVMAGSILLFIGSQKLVAIARGHFWTYKRLAILLVPFTLSMIVLAVEFLEGAGTLRYANSELRFSLPPSILLFSYFIPHTIVWLLGILSAVNIAWYARNVEGSIYKSLFTDIYKGIILVYLAIFSTQLLVSSTVFIQNVIITRALVYSILVLAVAGYAYLYKGSVKLQKIEEIV